MKHERIGGLGLAPSHLETKHKAPKWYLFYFLLATFNLLTVCFSLYLNRGITEIYNEVINEDQRLSTRLKMYEELGLLAGNVNAPGNDVFESGDVVGERQRMKMAYQKFQVALKKARR